MNETIPRTAALPASSRNFFAVLSPARRLVSGLIIGWFLTGWCGPATTATVRANEAAISSSTDSSSNSTEKDEGEFVLLRNDRVLRGDVQSSGESVIVRRGGSEIRLPAGEVIGSRDNLDALFELREKWRSARTSTRPTQRALSAARWCVDQGLHRQAVEQLMVVYRNDPQNSEAQHLESRLRNLTRPSDPEPKTSEVQQASFVETANETEQTNVAPENAPSSSDEPTDHLHDAVMNSWLLHAFTARVQPILLAKCAQCHDQNSSDLTSDFALHRPVHSSRPGRRITESNLRAILRLCEPGNPDASSLIQMAKSDHGAKASPRNESTSLPPGSVLLRTLESFVDQLPLPSELKVVEVDPILAETPRGIDPNGVAQASFIDEAADADFSGDKTPSSPHWPATDASESTHSQTANLRSKDDDKRDPARPKRLPKVEQPLSKDLFNRQTELIELFRGTLRSTPK
ncbi:hypothetical protein [Rhodopirellula baltica]|nr:hypothetical protein [Rhodopirellula baltica]